MNTETVEHKAKVTELEAKIAELLAENEILRSELARVGSLGNAEKERLLERILKEHPDAYNQIEFDDSFKEATEKD